MKRIPKQLVATLAACGIACGQGYLITDIAPGVANDINNLGHVVGDSGFFGFYYNGETRHSFTNIISSIIPAGMIGGPSMSLAGWTTAVAINDLDEIVGMRNRTVGFPEVAFVYPHSITNVGSAIMLESYSIGIVVTDINNSGRISAHWNTTGRTPSSLSYILGTGEAVNLEDWSQLHAINDLGTATGGFGTLGPAPDFKTTAARAMTVSSTGAITFVDNRPPAGGPGQVLSMGYGINNAGVVVGAMRSQIDTSQHPFDDPLHAFRSTGSGLEDLGTLGGTNSVANDINADGVIVGNAQLASGIDHAFIYTNGTMIDLNTLAPAGSGWELLSANAINNRGEIVGQGRFQGELRAYKLSPPGLANPPLIETNPVGARLALGETHTFSVSATGTGPFTYQWTLNGTNIVNATNSTYTIPSADAFSVGGYRALVTNIGGTVASLIARIDVLDPELAAVIYVGLDIKGAVGSTYRIEFLTSANASTWTTLTNLTLTSSPYSWIDADSRNHPTRIYRAVRLP